ncbi:MAG TPA: NAD-glutamate dehydrogenase [Thermoanaerobaculia bacterium]|nr:NAD-glutamate dehydrogenase [Thermoanaerobaculia bacterium]
MSITAEQRKAELVDRLAAEARTRVATEDAESANLFIQRYFALVAADDVIYTSFDTLLGSVLSLWELGAQRKAGTPNIRLFNPTVEKNGWASEHTVIEIVNDDMPFLVDSVAAEMSRRDRKIHLMLHPILRVRRDAKGRRLEMTDTRAKATDIAVESYMHLEIDQETDAGELESIQKSIENILNQVRLAVKDWAVMRERMRALLAELEPGEDLPMPPEEVEEAKEFLRWLDDGHFVFLGFRRYGFETKDGKDYLPPDPSSSLGILRRMRPESERRGAEPLSREFSEYARKKDLLIISKANTRSVVHRAVPMDRIGIKRYNAAGDLIGEDRFLGLFTSAAYSRSVREIPMLRLKANRTFDRSGLDPHSHNGKALLDILETFPRDEFFQITDSDLFDIARGILLLQDRQRVALFARRDLFERFVSAYVFVPRDRYTVEFKERARIILEEAFDGREAEVYDHVSANTSLARGLFIIRTTPGKIAQPDLRRVEAYLAEAARTWSDQLLDALVQSLGEDAGIETHRRYRKAFPLAYQEAFNAAATLYDLNHIEDVLKTDRLVVDLYRHRSEQRQFHVKIVHSGAPVPLSELMPRLENMGVRVQSEVPHEIQPEGAAHPVRIRDFTLDPQGMQDDLRAVKEKFQEAFVRVWRREAENDGFNRLVLAAELEWHEILILRTYAKYMRQIGLNLSEAYIQQTLANNPSIARQIIQLFNTHFDPQLGPPAMHGVAADAPDLSGRHLAAMAVRSQIQIALDNVANPDEDRILRLYVTLIEATLRTNHFQRDAGGERKPYVSFKLDSHSIRELPLPRPMFEIFVYAPFMEGVHLRAGKVARGGIRWSDRREDFRTEILGLMKAQNVKNVVIVPMGSKGGFVVKNPSPDRETFQHEGVESYKTLLRGMLDITDNLRGDEVLPPPDVVRRDPDDPYLVVAADKGTATFSDIANSVSAEYGFWLGDAFASGGSAGYDHKKMGITARGGWEAVKRHFRELGIDTQSQDFSVVGIGDMSGDVFGNAMLLSPHIKLIGAFNHSHIFIDPSPDPRTSYNERRRLFDMRLNWNGYNQQLLSKGGAVYGRSAKTITLSAEAQRLFELPHKTVTPAELIRATLRAPADLLWLGGIGTYVKSSDEEHAAAHDRANEAVRVNANELRVRVVGEGANLGFTQRARIEFNLLGGKINTDAIDNSAGVDTSDHEVNIKILLYDAMERGELQGGIEERNRILAAMTEEVAALVLRDNYEQTQAISITNTLGQSLLDIQARAMRAMEKGGKLDRAVEYLPDDETIADRHAAHLGLTRPEIAVLLAYSKIALYADLLASDLPDDQLLVGDLLLYFPEALRHRFPQAIGRHRLHREIIATYVTNNVINRLRPTFVWQMTDETGRPAADVARAFTIIRDTFELRKVWHAIEELDNKVPAALQVEMLISVGNLLERALRWILKSNYEKLDITAYVNEFRPRINAIEQRLDQILPPLVLEGVRARETRLIDAGIPQDLADRIAALDVMTSAMDIVRISHSEEAQEGTGVEEVARVYFGIGARFGLDRLRAAGAAIAADTPWQKAAVAALVDDLFNYQSVLASRVIGETNGSREAGDPVETWLAQRGRLLERVDQTMSEVRSAPNVDIAMLTVASRQLRALVES